MSSTAGRPKAKNSCFISQAGDQLKAFLSQALSHRKRRINLTLSSWKPCQGETVAILVSVPPPRGPIEWVAATLRQRLSKEPLVQVMLGGSEVCAYPTSADSGIWRALAPTTPLSEPGPRCLTVDVKDGRHDMYNGFLEICPKAYPVESIWLNESKSGIQGTVAEKEAVQAFVSSKSNEQNWCGPFALPAEGDVTTGFGLQRYYNGVFADGYYHRGVDYGADEGTPVRAPATGVVALVGRELDGFELHGNCVGLDHGQGVTSMLMHLSSVTVEKGVTVQAGQSVGTVGQSGLATGPHLHWGLFVNGEAVDPKQWMEEQPWL